MKKTITSIFLFIILFLSSYITIAQPWTENFNTQASGSYGSTAITINGREWTRSDAGNFSYANTNMGSYAFTINDDISNAHITSPSLNTCGTVAFKYAYINGSSSNVFILQKSFDNSSWTNLETHTLGAGSNVSYVDYSFDVNDDASQIYIRILSDDQSGHLFIEDYSVTAYVSGPNLTVTPTELNGFSYIVGSGPSASQTFALSGADLDGTEVTVTAPANYEVSDDDVTYGSSLTVNYTAPTLDATTIYVRLKAGLTEGDYNSETIICNDNGTANDVTVTCNGSVNAPAASPGDIVINEFMADPSCEDDAIGEYVELYNTTAEDIDISGWKLLDDGTDTHTFNVSNGTTVIQSGDYLVVGLDLTSECNPDYIYTSTLANGGDEIVLKDGDTEICRVEYTSTSSAKSYELPFGYDYSLADDGVILSSEFILSSAEFGTISCKDFGTPGKSTIPIELNTFSANIVKNQTLVSWSTLTETNNDYYVVEWSKGGKNFEELGKVTGKGISREKTKYNYTHTNPSIGLNYYRLAQYDLDGRSERFNVVSVYFDFDKENMIIVPNRIDNNLRIEFSQVVENGSLHIYNMEGKVVQSYILAKGIDVSNFDVSYLTSGQYIAKYIDTFGTITKKFIKL